MIRTLSTLLDRMSGHNVAVAVQEIVAQSEPLMAEERRAMTNAVPARLAEFAAGRSAARSAIRKLGLIDLAIPMGPDRAPVWPLGLLGSISHSKGVCAALVARTGPITGLGVDLEIATPLSVDLWAEVCSDTELLFLNHLPASSRGQIAKLIFAAKECCYKCIYPQIQTVLGFSAVEILIDQTTKTFRATLTQHVGPFESGTCWQGRFDFHGGLIVATMVLRKRLEL